MEMRQEDDRHMLRGRYHKCRMHGLPSKLIEPQRLETTIAAIFLLATGRQQLQGTTNFTFPAFFQVADTALRNLQPKESGVMPNKDKERVFWASAGH